MNTFAGTRHWFACGALILLAAPAGAQQLTTPYVANSANSNVYEILIDPPTASQVNSSPNAHVKLTSLTARPAFQFNGSQVADIAVNLYGTDQSRGQLIEWVEPTNESPAAPAILWQPSYLVHPSAGALKPTSPTGISHDSAGNLFLVHSTNNPKPGSVWVARYQELSQPLSTANNAPWPPQPRVIDRQAGAGTANARVLEETVVAPISVGSVATGDLLVLSRNPAMVLAYPLRGPHGIQDVLDDACVNCATDVEPIVLVGGSTMVTLPNGTLRPFSQFDPTGMDFYGDDLLVTTGRGEIVRIHLDELANPVPGVPVATIFRQGMGNGKSRLKTGWQSGSLAVFVTNQNRGSLIRLLDDGLVLDEVRGLQNPEGLALSGAAFEPVTNCVVGSTTNINDGCDPTVSDDTISAGGNSQVFAQQISSLTGAAPGAGVAVTPNANLLQQFCIVSAANVSAVLNGLPFGASPTIEDFCPGWGDELNPVIPPELIRDGEPLVFVETTAPGLVITHGLVETISDEFNLVPDFEAGEECPNFRTAWSPSEDGDNPVALDAGGNPVFEENLTGCGSLLRLGRGGSFHMIGPFTKALIAAPGNEDDKVRAFVLAKFDRLGLVIAATGSSPEPLILQIKKCVATARFSYEVASNLSKLAVALDILAKCDALVTATTPGMLTSTAYGNPGGDMLWRLRNIAFTIREHAGL